MTREKKFAEVMQKLDAQVRFELRQGNHSQVAELRQAIAKLEGWHKNNFIPESCPVNLESFKLQGWNVVEELPVPDNGNGNIRLVTKMLREAEGEENLTKALDQATQLINMGIDDPDMQRAVLIAEERLQSLQTLPVHPDEEVSGEENKLTGTIVDEKNQPAEKTSAASVLAQVESIDELLKKAGIALAEDKFDEAMELCRKVKDRTPDHPGALELEKMAASRKFRWNEEQRVKRLENTLNTSQEMDVEYAIRDVEALQAEGKATPELLEALRKARPRFEDIRKGRQIRTTAEAMGDYEGVCLTIKMLDKDLGLGVETWPDDRVGGGPRPVVDLLGEFRQLQAEKVKEPFDRFVAEAKNKKRIHPIQARILLEKALSLENLDIERKRQVEKELEEIAEAVRKWQEAEEAINEAKITALYDPRQACGHLARARNTYPDHADIDYVGGYLADLIASDNIPKIKRQIAESKRYQSQGLFEKALKVLDEIPSIPVGLPEHDGLKAAQAELKKTVAMVEDARQTAEIAEKAAEAISRELRSGKLEAALAIFKRQDEKVQQNARLQDIYSEMLAASGDTEGLVRQAKEAVENQQWQAACNILKKASEEGNYGRSQVRPLRIAAEIGLRKEEISRWLTERRYDRVQSSLNALLSVQGLEGSQKETLEKEYTDLIVEIKNRGKNDPEVRRLLGNARVIYQDNRLGDQRFVDTYEILLKAEMAESCLVGEVTAFKVEVYEGLCQSLSARLARSAKVVKAAKSQDAGDGIKILEQIKKYQMVCSEEDNQNRKIILNAHYLTQERVHQEHGRWENIIALWKEALGKFPNEVEFYQKLKSAQRNWLIQRINTALNESKFEDAGRLLTRENSYGLSEENAQRFDVSSDSELNSLNDATIILTEAQRLFEDQKYGAMVSYLERQIGSVPPPLPVIGIYLYKHRQTAATLLIQKGDRLMRNGQAPEAVIQFSEAVSVSPTDPSARARIAANLGQVREEVILRISKGYDCNVERYSNWVDDQLEEDRKLLESLDNLTAVLLYLGAEEEDFRRRLGLAAAKVKDTIQKLQDCADKLDAWKPDGRNWRSALQSGSFLMLNGVLQSLQTSLSAGHPQVQELSERKQKFEKLRSNLITALESLDREYRVGNYAGAITNLNQADALARQSSLEDNDDPFGLLRDKAQLFDLKKNETISGLVPIRLHLQAVQDNYERWKSWATSLEQLHQKLEGAVEKVNAEFNANRPTENGVQILDTALKIESEYNDLYKIKPQDESLSEGAEQIHFDAEGIAEKMQDSLEDLNQRKKMYQDSELYIDFEILVKQTVELINTENYGLAQPILLRLNAYRPEDEEVKYLLNICQNPPWKSHGLFGAIFGKFR